MFLFESIAKIHNELQNHRNEILDCRLPVIFSEFDFFNLGKTMMSLFWLGFFCWARYLHFRVMRNLFASKRTSWNMLFTHSSKEIHQSTEISNKSLLYQLIYMYIYLLRNKQRILYVPFKVKLTWIVKFSYYSYFDQIRIQIPPGNRDRKAWEGICYRICFVAV